MFVRWGSYGCERLLILASEHSIEADSDPGAATVGRGAETFDAAAKFSRARAQGAESRHDFALYFPPSFGFVAVHDLVFE